MQIIFYNYLTICLSGAVLNNSVAVVTVPEGQLFAVQQQQQVDAIQHEVDIANDEDVTGRAPNVNDTHELTINVDHISPSGLTGGGVLTEGASNCTSASDPKVSGTYCINSQLFHEHTLDMR